MSSASWWKWNCRVGDQRSMVLMVLSSATILVLYTKINLVKYTNIILYNSCQEPNITRSHGARDCLLLFAFSCNEVLTSVGLYRQNVCLHPVGRTATLRPLPTIGTGPRSAPPEIDVKSQNV